MSLLLDALNRAGKDKTAAPDSSAGSGAPVPDAAPSWPTLELSLAPADPVPATATDPATQPGITVSGEVAPPALMADVGPRANRNKEGSPELSAVQRIAETGPLDPQPTSGPEAATQEAAAVPVARPAVGAVPPSRPAADKLRAAETLRRAQQSGPSSPPASRRRLLILGSIALMLGAGLAWLFSGGIDPVALLSGSPSGPIAVIANAPAARPTSPPATEPQTLATEKPASADQQAQSAPAVLRPATTDAAPQPGKSVAISRTSRPAAARQSVPPPSPLPTGSATRTVAVVPECGPGLVPPECKPAPRPSRSARSVSTATSAAQPAAAPAVVVTRSVEPPIVEAAYLAMTQGQFAEALKLYQKALVEQPEDPDALLGLAYMAHQQGRDADAKGYYERVLRQEPRNATARAGLLALSPVADSQDYVNRSRENAEQHPDSAAAQSILGHGLAAQGRLADARLAFLRAHALEPESAAHAFNVAVASDRMRLYGQALLYYRRALTLTEKAGAYPPAGVSASVIASRIQALTSASVAGASQQTAAP